MSWRIQLLIVTEHLYLAPFLRGLCCLTSWKENVSIMNACIHVYKWFIVSDPFFGLLESWRFPVEASPCPSSMLSLRVLQLSSVLSNSFPNSFYHVMTLRIFSKVFSFKIPSLFLVWALPKSEIQFQQEFHLSNVSPCVCDSFTKNYVQPILVYTGTKCRLVLTLSSFYHFLYLGKLTPN